MSVVHIRIIMGVLGATPIKIIRRRDINMSTKFLKLVLGNFVAVLMVQIVMNLLSNTVWYENAESVFSYVAVVSFIEWYSFFRKPKK